jgi:hypothetical protein
VLAGKLKPNLGRFENAPDWQDILAYFRGSDLQVSLALPRHAAIARPCRKQGAAARGAEARGACRTTSRRSWKTTLRPSSSHSTWTRSRRR